jgi:ankyrin repeat protein
MKGPMKGYRALRIVLGFVSTSLSAMSLSTSSDTLTQSTSLSMSHAQYMAIYSDIMNAKKDSYFCNIPRDVRNLIVTYCRGDNLVSQWFHLMVACPSDICVVTQDLLKQDETLVNMRGAGGNHALLFMAIHNHASMLKLLLDHGADINLPNNKGSTALIKAAHYDKRNAVAFLILSGADLLACEQTGKIACDIAKEHNHHEIYTMICNAMKQ